MCDISSAQVKHVISHLISDEHGYVLNNKSLNVETDIITSISESDRRSFDTNDNVCQDLHN